LVFLRIPSFALGYHSSCDGSKASAGKVGFSVFKDLDLYGFSGSGFKNLDFGSCCKYLGWVRSFWRQYFKDSSVKVVSFQRLDSVTASLLSDTKMHQEYPMLQAFFARSFRSDWLSYNALVTYPYR
jgi:hypothetical protein